jgi:hypothetical protein
MTSNEIGRNDRFSENLSFSGRASLFGRLTTEQVSRREKQDCTKSSSQYHYSRTPLGHCLDVASTIMVALITLIPIVSCIRQSRENQGDCY